MYHKCVKCGQVYERASEEIITGCTCGSKLFYFLKSLNEEKKKKQQEEMEYFIELEDDDSKEIMIFDIEAINIKGSGKYELNIDGLMNSDGLIYKYGEGKYSIDIETPMRSAKRRK